jgi:hypothetical protein
MYGLNLRRLTAFGVLGAGGTLFGIVVDRLMGHESIYIWSALFGVAVCFVLGAILLAPDLRALKAGVNTMVLYILSGGLIASGIALASYAYFKPQNVPAIPIAFEIKRLRSFAAKHPFVDVASGDPDAGTAMVWDYGPVLISNISRDTAVTLEIHLRIKGPSNANFSLRADGQGPFGRVYGVNDKGTLMARNAGVSVAEVFISPVHIPPQQSVQRDLKFFFGPPPELRVEIIKNDVKGLYDYGLEITDNISGVTISVPIPAKYRGA